MAIKKEDLDNQSLYNIEKGLPELNGKKQYQSWEGYSGDNIEDYITRRLANSNIVSMDYVGTTLILTKEDGTTVEQEVTSVSPTYEYGIKIFGLKIGENTYSSGNLTISNSSEVKLLVGAYGTIQLAGDPKDKGGQVNISITYESSNGRTTMSTKLGLLSKDSFEFNTNNDIIKLKEGISPIELDLKELLAQYQNKGTITIELIPNAAEEVEPITDVLLGVTLTCELPVLKYTSELYTISTNEITFNLSGGTSEQYELSGFNNGQDIGELSDLTYSALVPGLNQLVVRAKHKEYNSNKIVSNWVVVDLICTANCEQTVIAVNGVSDGIINNGIAELYHLTIFSPSNEELILDTYLEEAQGLLEGTNLIKRETINPYSYDTNKIYKTNYKKYIEESISGDKFLMVCTNETTYYKFYTPTVLDNLNQTIQKRMTVEEPNTNFMYYKDSPRIYNYDQITGQNNNVFEKANINPKLEATDGWGENEGICYFRATAQSEPVFLNDLDLKLQQSSGFSLEFGFRTYNVSNKSKPILSLGKLQLWPTQLVWWDAADSAGEQSAKFTSRNSQFQEGVDTHIMITVHPSYKISENDPYFADFLEGNQDKYKETVRNYSFNLVRVYIDGRIDRGFILSNDELSELANSRLSFNPTTSDIDLYLLRVYNTAGLSDDIVQRNYNSFIFDKLQKQDFYNHNDITEEINGYKVITFSKARLKQNTIVLVLPKGVSFPNYTWDDAMEKLAKKNPATMFIGYADSVLNQQYGGRITNGQIKGQGSSAKRYLIWNVQNSLGKYKDDGLDSIFISYSPANFDADINKFKVDATTTQKNCYVMPTYTGQEDTGSKVKKAVGKINWASSMQSHKIGACKLYEDAYKAKYRETIGVIGKKAVHEEAFLYFYWETDLENVSTVELADVLAAGTNVKFAGFQTWGAGKGDKYESGYGDDTPEYLMLEGGENANTTVNFRCPWHALQTVDIEGNITNTPTTSISDSLANPEMNVKIDDESIVYQNQGAWDIDFGCHDNKVEFLPEVKRSLIRFRQFYDFVYKHDFTFIVKSGLSCDAKDFITTNAEGNPVIDTEHKYVVTVPTGKFTINGTTVSNYKPGDVYRYDVMLKTWVPAGLYYENESWQRYNVFEEYPEAAGYIDTVREFIKRRFQEGIKEFIDLNDIAFHQAFIKFVSGTDNRAKNTYFQIIGPKYIEVGEDQYERPEIEEGDWSEYKIRLIGDDLDTIFVTDNSGLQSKPYNLLEVSYDASFKDHWGDAHNIFFYMFDQCFEKEIIENLKAIIDKAFGGKSMDNKDSYFYNNFFKVQENYPAVAYNHTSRLYYENAYVIKENGVIPGYENNLGVDPIGQIHGSCLPCEKQFMTERMDFLNGYAQTNLSNYYATDQVGGATHAMKVMLEFTPYQDFYPNYGYGAAGGGGAVPYYVLGSDTGIKAVEALAKKDQLIETVIDRPDAQTYQGIFQMHLYKTLNILGSNESKLPSLQRGTDLYIDNENVVSGVSQFKLTQFDGKYPVLESLSLKNIELPSTLPLTDCVKLKSIDLTGSITQEVALPISGRLQTMILPNTIKKFEINNNPGLTSVTFEGYDNIETVYIDCAKCGEFDVSDFCEKIKNNSLSEVLLYNCNLTLTEESLLNLCKAETCNITGTIEISDKLTFEGKKELVAKFGNIDNANNELYIQYPKTNVSVTVPESINVFYKKEGLKNPFNGFLITGNNIEAINNDDKWYLNVLYFIEGDANVIVNQYTGQVTFNNVPSADSAKAYIKVNNIKSEEATAWFTWQRPYVGQFVYNDGSYSKELNQTKKLIGIIYDVKKSEDKYTTYILGKDLSFDRKFVSYFTKHYNVQNTNPSGVYAEIKGFAKNIDSAFNLNGDRPNITTSVSVDDIEDIYDDKFRIIQGLEYNHGTNTKKVVDWVNLKILPTLYKEHEECKKYIDKTSQGLGDVYKITSINNLIDLCDTLANSKKWNTETDYNYLNASIVYPYFYAAYLYKPNCDTADKISNAQWYAPSISELAKIAYLFGFSVTKGDFTDAKKLYIFEKSITTQDDITYKYPESFDKVQIFTQALNKLGLAYPKAWEKFSSNTYLSASASDGQFYGYVRTITKESAVYHGSWEAGVYRPEYYYNWSTNYDKYDLWAYNKRTGGLVFTHIDYTEGE